MDRGEWYKQFGTGHTAFYYHIIRVEHEDTVRVEQFTYDEALKMIRERTMKTFKAKEWMEEVLKNNIYHVPRENVPFILPV